ncbi:hypothetical protein ACFWBX_23825 [Streptomyces sp. NPDC059991]|uniref:hypothetical protein n=1 Tax=Streptomyces sp. NPDC059991 TaxID=3347028 RepID=UPI0036C4D46C
MTPPALYVWESAHWVGLLCPPLPTLVEPSVAVSALEQPLTSEPPLADAAPLTSEPPLTEAAPLTSEPTPVAAPAGA